VTRATRKVVCAAIAAACFAVATPNILRGQAVGAPAADDEGPVIIGQRRQYERFHLDRPDVALDLTNVYQRDRTTSAGSTTTSEQFVLEQVLELATHGYVLSPNFFDLTLSGSAGLDETWVSTTDASGSASDSSISTLYEWDVQGIFQPNGPSPLTLYSRREQGWIFREFGPALETVTTDTGATLELRSRKLPTRFGVSHLESEQSGFEETDDFDYTRDAFNWHTTYLPTDNQTVNWDYNFARVDQRGVTDQQYQTHDARLSHELVFGQRRRNSLTSTLNYYTQSGDINLERFRFDERLRLQHTDNFRTRYDYTYDQTNVGGSDNSRHRASAGFTHQLYDSLTTTGDVGVQRSEAGGGTADEIFAAIDFAYRKQVPLGLFSANLGLAWSRQNSESQSEPIPVIDQPAAFGDAQPIVITGGNVDPNTIVITDPSGLLIYQPGVDYTITQFPDRVEIDRVIGGQIGAGQAVVLDYQLMPLPAAVTTSNAFTAGVRYDFQKGPLKGLTLYTHYAQANQDIDTDNPGAFVLNEFTDVAYGVEYRFWYVTLGAEHQDHDSTINPFEADRLFARYSQRVQDNTLVALNASYTAITYFEPPNQLDLFTLSAQLQHRFSPRLTGTLTVLYRNEDDGLRGRTTGFEQQLELRWRHRQTQLYTLLRNAQLDNVDQDQSFQFVQLGLRRQF
jgi:hypothetical protein